jgi:ABC-type amino acid transport system permease subunit
MEIGKMIAAHHQLAYGTARLQHTKSMAQAAFVAVDFVRKTPLQGLARVITALLCVAYAVEQLAAQRTLATIELSLEIDAGWNN